jgi:hypothetical protein
VKSLLVSIGWLAAILATSAALSLVFIAKRPSMSAPWTRGPAIEVVSGAATSTPEGVEQCPSKRIAHDRTHPNRLYAAGSVSEDSGRSWRPLTSAGVSVRPSEEALPPVPGPDGRLLVGGVRFEGPGAPADRSAFVPVAEWRDGLWVPFGTAERPTDTVATPADRQVRGLGYTPDGTAVVATERGISTFDGRSWPTPGRLTGALVSETGAIYVAINEEGRFGLYRADSLGAPWIPIAGASGVDMLTEGAGALLVISGMRLGRLDRGQWTWTDLPSFGQPRGLAAHPTRPLIAAWDGSQLLTSSDGGREFRASPLGFEVEWAVWDPFATDTLTLVDRKREIRQLSLQALP